MIITLSGVAGSGKSTVARIVAAKLGWKHYSIGDFMRELAKKRGMSVLELSKIAENDRSVDDALDSYLKALGRSKDIVVDSRLGYFFIPNSFKVFLNCTIEESARRIFGAGRNLEKENITLEQTRKNITSRKASERLRYSKLYGTDPYRLANYDLVINSTKSAPEQVAQRIIAKAK